MSLQSFSMLLKTSGREICCPFPLFYLPPVSFFTKIILTKLKLDQFCIFSGSLRSSLKKHYISALNCRFPVTKRKVLPIKCKPEKRKKLNITQKRKGSLDYIQTKPKLVISKHRQLFRTLFSSLDCRCPPIPPCLGLVKNGSIRKMAVLGVTY